MVTGGVVWAEQYVPSGLAALLIATVPLWMALLAWWRGDTPRPTGRIAVGLLLGLTGVALLVAARGMGDARGVNPVGAIVLVLASLSWAHGSLVSRHAPLPSGPFLATAMKMRRAAFSSWSVAGAGGVESTRPRRRFDPFDLGARCTS